MEETEKANEEKEDQQRKKPRFDGKKLGEDPSKCPEEGFEWKGNGPPETRQGNWVNKDKKEKLYLDLNHPEPIEPHWDYSTPEGKYRLFLDGSWESK